MNEDLSEENIIEKLEKNKIHIPETLYTLSRMYDVYSEYANTIEDKKIFSGIETIDKSLGGFRPSELITLIGGTNVGKSAFAMNVMFHASRQSKGLIVLFSLEMSEIDIWERFLQMEYDYNTFEIENIFKKRDEEKLSQIKSRIENYKNVYSVVKRISIDDVIPYVKTIEDIKKEPVTFVVIDHSGLIKNNNFQNIIQRAEDTASKLKEIALHLKIPVLNFSQTSRSDIKDKKELGLYSAKNSGEIENSSQIVFTLEKVKEFDPSIFSYDIIENNQKGNIDILKLTTQKKKRGIASDVHLIFNRKNLKITEYGKVPDLTTSF